SWLYNDDFSPCYESPQFTKAHRIMKNMRWKGKGLGPNEQGHLDPINYTQHHGKHGLGFKVFDVAPVLISSDNDDTNSDSDTRSTHSLFEDLTETHLYFEHLSVNVIDFEPTHLNLIDHGQSHHVAMDMFQNDEAIKEFLGTRDQIPTSDHRKGFEINLDELTYF
ncbi:hypothetical protein KI387_039550, partial [Taxus chinensis]